MVAVDGDRVYLDLTEKDGVQPGQEFTVFRKGDVFRHPFTRTAARPLRGHPGPCAGAARAAQVLARRCSSPSTGRARCARRTACGSPGAGSGGGAADAGPHHGPGRPAARALHDRARAGPDQALPVGGPRGGAELLLNQQTRSEELLVRPEKAVALGRTLEVSGWLVPVLIERRGTTYLDVTWISGGDGHAALLTPPGPDPGAEGGGAALPLGAARRGLRTGLAICYALPAMKTPRLLRLSARALHGRRAFWRRDAQTVRELAGFPGASDPSVDDQVARSRSGS